MSVIVFDVGKTNVKLLVVEENGDILHSSSTANKVVSDDPWRRHDLASIEAWLVDGLAQIARSFSPDAFICSGHGSTGVLVSSEDLCRSEPECPMIDYEQSIPAWLDEAYQAEGLDFFDRGSPIMLGATHQARQMLWVEKERPDLFAKASSFLGLPQYWAWRLSGEVSSEITYLAAQSGLWNLSKSSLSAIAQAHNWGHLLPPRQRADYSLGSLRPELVAKTGLPATMAVKVGIHDSSANFFNYQADGMADVCLVSTGTWIVGLTDKSNLDLIHPERGMIMGADIGGAPLIGSLSMAGRAFSDIAGEGFEEVEVHEDDFVKLVQADVMALPTFGKEDGMFPGTANKGRITGPAPQSRSEKKALALLHSALQVAECISMLGGSKHVVLDGAYAKDPLYASLLAAILGGRDIETNPVASGVALGAAKLAMGADNANFSNELNIFRPLTIPGIETYAQRWSDKARSL